MDATMWIALLGGVNVGGKNRLAMTELAAMFTASGCRDVRTYIQSGNVVFAASPDVTARLPDRIAGRIADAFGYRTPVILRSAAQLAAVAAANPFLASGAAEDTLHVMFLADAPAAGRVDALDPAHSPPDVFRVLGREVYLHAPNGLARTRLTNAYFDSRLATTSTARNWRTVTKLLAMAGGQSDSHSRA